jgi:hypothetical protein
MPSALQIAKSGFDTEHVAQLLGLSAWQQQSQGPLQASPICAVHA